MPCIAVINLVDQVNPNHPDLSATRYKRGDIIDVLPIDIEHVGTDVIANPDWRVVELPDDIETVRALLDEQKSFDGTVLRRRARGLDIAAMSVSAKASLADTRRPVFAKMALADFVVAEKLVYEPTLLKPVVVG